jgi:hypothetical protein
MPKTSRQNGGTEEKFSNAKNIPAIIEPPRKKSQMPKTSRQNRAPPKSRHRGKILKCQKHPAIFRGTEEKFSNAKNLSLLSSHNFFTSDFCPQSPKHITSPKGVASTTAATYCGPQKWQKQE